MLCALLGSTKTCSYYCHLLPIPIPPVWLICFILPHLMTCHQSALEILCGRNFFVRHIYMDIQREGLPTTTKPKFLAEGHGPDPNTENNTNIVRLFLMHLLQTRSSAAGTALSHFTGCYLFLNLTAFCLIVAAWVSPVFPNEQKQQCHESLRYNLVLRLGAMSKAALQRPTLQEQGT